jgi:poly[ADP-ribose] polymerase 16
MSLDSKKSYILSRIKTDPLAADIQISLFYAALQSYRHDTVLRPFPNKYLLDHGQLRDHNQHKDYNKLASNTDN